MQQAHLGTQRHGHLEADSISRLSINAMRDLHGAMGHRLHGHAKEN
jgi:hypothetical protein